VRPMVSKEVKLVAGDAPGDPRGAQDGNKKGPRRIWDGPEKPKGDPKWYEMKNGEPQRATSREKQKKTIAFHCTSTSRAFNVGHAEPPHVSHGDPPGARMRCKK
jgi:hypothetical protein